MDDLQTFKNFLLEEEKSPLTIQKYLRDVSKFLHWLSSRELTKGETRAYKAWLTEQYTPASVNSMLSALNRYLDFISREDCKVKFIRIQREVFYPVEKELTREEYQRLLRAAKDDTRLCLLMQTICSTGIRVSEHRYITVEAVRQQKATVRCKGKIRTVLLPRKLCKALQAYIRQNRIRSGSVFVGNSGKPLDRSRIWAQMKKLCRTAKVQTEKVFPHNLRHLFARMYYAMEKDIVRLADILGHSSINTTRIYTKESGDIHRRQIEKIPLLFIT